MNRRLWFDRNFHLGLPLEVLPNILEPLVGTPARLEEVIRMNPPYFVAEHDDHHLASIREMMRAGSS